MTGGRNQLVNVLTVLAENSQHSPHTFVNPAQNNIYKPHKITQSVKKRRKVSETQKSVQKGSGSVNAARAGHSQSNAGQARGRNNHTNSTKSKSHAIEMSVRGLKNTVTNGAKCPNVYITHVSHKNNSKKHKNSRH